MTTQELEKPTGKQNNGHYSAGEKEAQGLEALRLKVLGFSDIAIAEKMGLSRNTVAARLKAALATHGPSTVAEYREIAKQRYELGIRVVAARLEANPDDLEALKIYLDATSRYVRLVGAEAPVAVDVEVHHVTTQEKELREMLAQAERDEKARESVIVEGQVVDG